MDTELALKINKYIHEQCIDGVPHDIGWNVVKLFCQPAVSGTFCEKCNPNGVVDDNVIRCKKCGRGIALVEQNYH